MKTSSKRYSDLANFLALGGAQRALLLRAFVALLVFKGLHRLLSFRLLRCLTGTRMRRPGTASPQAVEAAAWAVRVVSAKSPVAFTCLVQALTARWLLGSHPDLRVRLGVRRGPAEPFAAHAWLEWRGRVVLGDQPGPAFTPLFEWS